jgi:hypothetical protein
MNPKLSWLIPAILLAMSLRAESQQPKKMARIGYLSAYSGPHPSLAAFRDELRELGWIEGKTSHSSTAMAGAKVISILILRLNLSASMLMSSSPGLVMEHLAPPNV